MCHDNGFFYIFVTMAIATIISDFIKNWSSKESLYLKIGKVSEINTDEQTFTFTPLDETSAVLDVRMKTIADNALESFVIVPKDGSQVVVGFHSNTVAQCLVVKESQKILINTETIESNSTNKTDTIAEIFKLICDDVQVTSESFVFNGGSNEGIIKIIQLTEKLNLLVSQVNNLKLRFNIHKHTGVSTGGGVSGITDILGVDATDFSKSDYEDTNIKH